jgi:hypothetical protein
MSMSGMSVIVLARQLAHTACIAVLYTHVFREASHIRICRKMRVTF